MPNQPKAVANILLDNGTSVRIGTNDTEETILNKIKSNKPMVTLEGADGSTVHFASGKIAMFAYIPQKDDSGLVVPEVGIIGADGRPM